MAAVVDYCVKNGKIIKFVVVNFNCPPSTFIHIITYPLSVRLVLEYCCWYTDNKLTSSIFNALSIWQWYRGGGAIVYETGNCSVFMIMAVHRAFVDITICTFVGKSPVYSLDLYYLTLFQLVIADRLGIISS